MLNNIYGTDVEITPLDFQSCEAIIETLRHSKLWVLERYKSLAIESLAETFEYTKKPNALHSHARQPRLDNIDACTRNFLESDVSGDFVDIDTLWGRKANLMRGILHAAHETKRAVIVFWKKASTQ
ncbi:TylF/MycF/NovP-related O-methyltransferase [Pararobbsia alpina]|uniref:TylF/MycF/NovP-related O-methyltransferase n=1 Tax=Pararobbsia alpina TaxID=621374 RepID=UPI0039A4422A